MSSVTTEVTGPIEVPVFNAQGQPAGSVKVDPAEFGGKINKQLLHEVVLMYLANQRAGTASTLRRGEVAGSTKKLFRQKGTGNARVGPRRTNKRRGGGTAKGPKPRDHEYHLPKQAVRIATRMAILSKFRDQEAAIIDDLAVPDGPPKTKNVALTLKSLISALKLDEVKVTSVEGQPPPTDEDLKKQKKRQLRNLSWLIGTAALKPEDQTRIHKSARNIAGVKVLPTSQLNTYSILRHKRLLLTKAAYEELRKGNGK
jgi:large subunit ribosomal protein L4